MASPKAALTHLKKLFPEVELRILRAALFIHGSDIQKASEYLLDEVCPGNARRNVSSGTGSAGNASPGSEGNKISYKDWGRVLAFIRIHLVGPVSHDKIRGLSLHYK